MAAKLFADSGDPTRILTNKWHMLDKSAEQNSLHIFPKGEASTQGDSRLDGRITKIWAARPSD
jgi:hypothetical protein